MSDRANFYFAQLVGENELDLASAFAELADRDFAVDAGLAATDLSIADGGIMAGGSVDHSSGLGLPQNGFTARITAAVGYDSSGRRIKTASTLNVDTSRAGQTPVGAGGTPDGAVITPGGVNQRWVSLYLFFDRELADPRIDGTGTPVNFQELESFRFFTKAGPEAPAPPSTPDPALESGKLLLCDIRISNTQMLEINISRRQDWIVRAPAGGPFPMRLGTPRAAIAQLVQNLADHILGVSGDHEADDVSYAGGSDWADSPAATTNPATNVEAQLDKFITDLIATTAGHSGAHKVGSAAVAGAPLTLAAATIGAHISSIVARYNNHVTGVADRHAATHIDYSGSGNFADAVTNLPAASVEATFDTAVSLLAASGGSPSGADLVGSRVSAAPGSPTTTGLVGLTAGKLWDQLVELKNAINGRVRRAGDTMTGDLTPDTASGTGLGTTALPFKLLALKPAAITDHVVTLRPFDVEQQTELIRAFGTGSLSAKPAAVLGPHAHWSYHSAHFHDDFFINGATPIGGDGAFFGPGNFWEIKVTGAGAVNPIPLNDANASGSNGAVRLATGATGMATIRSRGTFDPAGGTAQRLHLYMRLKRSNTGANTNGFAGWQNNTAITTRILQFQYTGGGNWHAVINDAGVATDVDLGAGATDTNWHTFEIILRASNKAEFYIDGSPLTEITHSVSGLSGGEWNAAFVRADATAGASVDIDVDVFDIYGDAY
jgi:hypothetical protein